MPQKFAFTTAAMAAALEETPVSYEDLADIERAFDDAETDISEFALGSRAALRWLWIPVRWKRARALSYQIISTTLSPAAFPANPTASTSIAVAHPVLSSKRDSKDIC